MSASARTSERPHARPQPSTQLRKSGRTRAAAMNAALEFLWAHPFQDMTVATLTARTELLGRFDAATARIEADQAQGPIPEFDARPVAVAFNRLDAHTLIEAFGRRPGSRPEPVLDAFVWLWTAAVCGVPTAAEDAPDTRVRVRGHARRRNSHVVTDHRRAGHRVRQPTGDLSSLYRGVSQL